jgi:hypothetical protein
MEEKEAYSLVQTYLLQKYFISTAYRQSSVMMSSPPWYYETIVWEWDEKTRKSGSILYMGDSGNSPEYAIKQHFKIVEKLHNKESLEND